MSSQIPNPANLVTTISSSRNHVGNKIDNNRTYRQPAVTCAAPLVKHRQTSCRLYQGITFKAKALALLIAVGTLALPANRATASYFSQQSFPELRTQAEQARIDNSEDIVSGSPNQLPLTLIIETIVASLLLVGLLTAFFANRSMRPNKGSTEEDKKSSTQPEEFSTQLVTQAQDNSTLLETVNISEQQAAVSEQAKLLTEISLRIRQAQYLEDLLKTAVRELRRAIKADRVFFYRFNPDRSGFVVAESVMPGWPSCLKIKVTDTYFTGSNPGIEQYKNGRVCVNDDIYTANLNDCHIRLLEQFAIKAQMVAPVLKNNDLFGLLIANSCSEPRAWQQDEIDLFVELAKQVGFAIEQVTFLEKQEDLAEKADLLTEVTLRIRQAQFLEELLKTSVKEVRRAIKTDRVLIFGLDASNWDGIVVAESVAPGWPQTLRVRISDPCLRNQYVEKYKNGHITAINNVYHQSVEECYRNRLEQFAVKANLVAPILKNNQLLGLLIAHQCSEPREWQPDEIDLFAQLAIQIGYAIDQVSLLVQLEEQTGHEKLGVQIEPSEFD